MTVRLVYHYRDGRTFTTETMLKDDALVYMRIVGAVATTPNRYTATWGYIDFEEV